MKASGYNPKRRPLISSQLTNPFLQKLFCTFAPMKTLCLILSLYVFYLSTVTCCSDDNCNDEIQTEQTDNHSENDHGDRDCSICSPFLTCGMCSGFIFSKMEFYFKRVYFNKSKMKFFICQYFLINDRNS